MSQCADNNCSCQSTAESNNIRPDSGRRAIRRMLYSNHHRKCFRTIHRNGKSSQRELHTVVILIADAASTAGESM